MNIFETYLCPNFIKIYSKTHQIAPFKKFSREHAAEPPSKRMAPPLPADRSNSKNSCPPPP